LKARAAALSFVLDEVDAALAAFRPRVAPDEDVADPALHGTQHVRPELVVHADGVGGRGQRQGACRRGRVVVLVPRPCIDAKDLQRERVAPTGHDHVDVPARHRAVEEPAACRAHDVYASHG
jgi:hypothetical protein